MGKRPLAKHEKTVVKKINIEEAKRLVEKYFHKERWKYSSKTTEMMARLICECTLTQHRNNEYMALESQILSVLDVINHIEREMQKGVEYFSFDLCREISEKHQEWAKKSVALLEAQLHDIGFNHGRDLLWVTREERRKPKGNQIAEKIYETLLAKMYIDLFDENRKRRGISLPLKLKGLGNFLSELNAGRAWIQMKAPSKSEYFRLLSRIPSCSINESNFLCLANKKGEIVKEIAFHKLELRFLNKNILLDLLNKARPNT